MYHQDATNAVREATGLVVTLGKPHAIAYSQSKGWLVYDPANGCPEGVPELLCMQAGYPPLPLSYDGLEVWMSIIRSTCKQA